MGKRFRNQLNQEKYARPVLNRSLRRVSRTDLQEEVFVKERVNCIFDDAGLMTLRWVI